jgi:glucokinase
MNTISDPDANFISIDLGGTQLRVARVSSSGVIQNVERAPTYVAGGPTGVIAQIEEMVSRARDLRSRSIGLGLPGAFDIASGTVLGIPALPGWERMPIAAELQDRTGLPCRLENDAKAAAIGEWHAGAGKGCHNFVYITVSTGIGACAIVDGHLLRGVGGLAGELGHARIAETSEQCACGLYGCWQALAAGPALSRRAEAAALEAPHSLLASLSVDGVIAGEAIGAAARAGDATALLVIREHARLVGVGFANVQHAYSPERLVVGGGVSALLDLMRPVLEEVLKERLLPGFQAAEIWQAALGDDAGLVGLAEVARKGLA